MELNATTFAIELVNFLLLAWVLQRLLYRPLRQAIDKRKQAMEASLVEANQRMSEAQSLNEQAQERIRDLEALREGVLSSAREQAEEERARIMGQARQDAEAEHSRARRLLDEERLAAMAWVRETTVLRSTEVAGRLMVDLVPQALEQALVEMLLSKVASEHKPTEKAGEPDAVDAEVELTTAHGVSDESITLLRRHLTALLGTPPRLSIQEDPALEAGCVLRIGHRVLDASVAGQLDILRDRAREILEESEAAHG